MSNKQGFRSLSFFESNIIDPDPYLQQCRKKYAVISLCIGVGQGLAMIIEAY